MQYRTKKLDDRYRITIYEDVNGLSQIKITDEWKYGSTEFKIEEVDIIICQNCEQEMCAQYMYCVNCGTDLILTKENEKVITEKRVVKGTSLWRKQEDHR